MLAASNDAIMAVSKCRRRVFVWGIDADQSVLGIGCDAPQDAIRRVELPLEIAIDRRLGPKGTIQAIALGGDLSWILLEDGHSPRGVWSGSGVPAS